MKRVRFISVFPILTVAVIVLSSCQTTPEKDIVINKGEDVVESLLREDTTDFLPEEDQKADDSDGIINTDSENTSENNMNGSTAEASDVIHYEDTFEGTDSEVVICVNADVKPFLGSVSVSETIPHTITSDEVQEWTEILFLENEAYEFDSTKTKEELEQLIADNQKWLESLDPLVEPELYEYRKNNYENAISVYQEQLSEVPDTYDHRKAEWIFKPETEYSEIVSVYEPDPYYVNQEIKVTADVEGKTAYADCQTCLRDDFILNSYEFWVQNGYQEDPLQETEDYVENYINEKLDELGFSERWRIKDIDSRYQQASDRQGNYFNTAGYYYEIELAPYYGGCEVLPQEQIYYSPDIAEYSFRYYYESLEIRYSCGHIVYLNYMAPLEEVSVMSSDAELLSFEEAMQRFTEQMQLQTTLNSFLSETEATPSGARVNISSIEAGLARVRIKDTEARYYMMPVWNFKGTITLEYADMLASDESTKDARQVTSVYSDTILTLNAIDGSVINISQGY